jgi:pimeloyl-ACP methyl ester carboxylesterase
MKQSFVEVSGTRTRIAEWVNDLCIMLDIKDFYLLAHSRGGQIAMYYYSKYFENVIKMPLTHMMHWENQESVISEIKNWFR